MRIAIIGPTHPYKGGIAQYTTQLAHHLCRVGYCVRIESWSHQYPRLLYPGILTVRSPECPVYLNTVRLLSWWRPDSWLRRGLVIRRDSDLVVLVIASPVQIPAYLGVLAMLRRGPRRPRVVAQCHNVLPHERRPVDVYLMRSVLGRVDQVLVHSEEQARAARTLTGVPVVVQRMAPLVVARASDGVRGRRTSRRLLFFGMVRPYKGLDILLRALATGPPDVSLVVAGEFWGGVAPFEKMIADLGIGHRVDLRPGYVDARDVPALFQDVDALVLPYRSATASLNAYLGFEHGVPVIATRVGTLPQDVRDGVDGLLCDPDDVASLAAALHRLYDDGVAAGLRAGICAVDADPYWREYERALVGVATPAEESLGG